MQSTLHVFEEPDEFLDAAGAWLEPQEVEANLVLGVARRLRERPQDLPRPWYLAVLRAAELGERRVVGVALRTPPWRLILHAEPGFEQELARQVADDLLARAWPPSGVNGRVPVSASFAREWQARTGEAGSLHAQLRVFKLVRVVWPRPARGALRPVRAADAGLLAEWVRAFRDEATPEAPAADADSVAQRMVELQTAWLWEVNGAPVSLAATNRVLPHGIVIGPVYTPPEQRRRGYAANAVAHLSASLLQAGHDYVALFTDLANPTSNHIYHSIGYEPVCDYADFSFAAQAATGAID